MAAWMEAARQRLRELSAGLGWAYRRGGTPAVEPSVLAALALAPHDPAKAAEVGRWLGQLQQPDGSLGVSATQASPRWPTSYALWLWNTLADPEFVAPRDRAAQWLLGQAGNQVPNNPSIVGHDTMLRGWPWVHDTHSWVEPTAATVLALARRVPLDHPRLEEAFRLLRDRAIVTGGWNYGNRETLGAALRPQPAPTGWALLALALTGSRDAVVEAGVKYLLTELPPIRSGQSLCWGTLGLRAWGALPPDAADWLADAWPKAATRSSEALEIAYLLLAAEPATLRLLGAESKPA